MVAALLGCNYYIYIYVWLSIGNCFQDYMLIKNVRLYYFDCWYKGYNIYTRLVWSKPKIWLNQPETNPDPMYCDHKKSITWICLTLTWIDRTQVDLSMKQSKPKHPNLKVLKQVISKWLDPKVIRIQNDLNL